MYQEACQTMLHAQTRPKIDALKQAKRNQVGLLGGNFNPVHQAHLIIADQVGNQLGLDRVCLLPSAQPPHVDRKETINPAHRLAMLELATANNSLLAVETLELERGGKSYTIDTLKRLKNDHPDTDYYFIIGGDMVEYLPKWKDVDELFQLATFVGVARPSFAKESSYPIIWIDLPIMELSSSMIRKKIAGGCSVRYLLPENVIDYIHKKGLYLDEG